MYSPVYVYNSQRFGKDGAILQQSQKMVRKQYFIYPSQAEKLRFLAEQQNISAAEVVRQAIDAFDPHNVNDMSEPELLALTRSRIKEAINETIATRKRVQMTIDEIENRQTAQRKVA